MVGGKKTTPQDLPPQSGYPPFDIGRVRLRRLFRAPLALAALATSTIGGFWAYTLGFKEITRQDIEKRSMQLAVVPILLAERDRKVMMTMHLLRKEEAELMKDYEGWKVGSYYGEPIYTTDDINKWRELNFMEYFVHSPRDDWSDRLNMKTYLV